MNISVVCSFCPIFELKGSDYMKILGSWWADCMFMVTTLEVGEYIVDIFIRWFIEEELIDINSWKIRNVNWK